MFNRKSALALGGAIFVVLLAVASAHADNPYRTSYLTFSGPVSLPGVTLAAGTYEFDLPVATSNLALVRVRSRDRSTVYYTGFTLQIARPEGLGDRQIALGEARADTAPPIKAWFPVGDSFGHQFNYGR